MAQLQQQQAHAPRPGGHRTQGQGPPRLPGRRGGRGRWGRGASGRRRGFRPLRQPAGARLKRRECDSEERLVRGAASAPGAAGV
eukprot:1062019-Pyramimonas_sp.AAC.1